MKKILSVTFLLALLASACNQDDILQQSNSSNLFKFTASFEKNGSRNYIDANNDLHWSECDKISLFYANTDNQQYLFDGKTGDTEGSFSPVETPSNIIGSSLTKNYAIYPYTTETKISENGVITAILPATQNYIENSFGLGSNTMVAVTKYIEDKSLFFKNVGGYLKLQLYGDDVTIKTITLIGNNNEKLAGKATITPAYDKEPIVNMADDATKSITLNCGENGVKISSANETASIFWIVVPPTEFEKGFTIRVKDINDKVFTQSTSKAIEIERNKIVPMQAIKVVPEIPYLTFKANNMQTLQMSKAVSTLEYYDYEINDWKELGVNIVSFGGEKGILRLRGKNLNGTATNSTDYSQFVFGSNEAVSCEGDIRVLIDYENYTKVETNKALFCSLFYNCTSLTTAPELPATDLRHSCYSKMFSECTSLVAAPQLPATILSNSCYARMFSGCTSLIDAPELPATVVESGCYESMFMNCTNLRTPPKLPAITLNTVCYSEMFSGCTSLVAAPQLPATILSNSCYARMFSGCTSLTDAPELPATTLNKMCYYEMFSGCTSLVAAPKLDAMILTESCYARMFSGCTSLITAPQLPAMNLSTSCYSSMFYNCTSLTTAPELPATKLANSCYSSMFYFCNKLNKITMLATDIKATDCLSSWVRHVNSTGLLIKAKNMESLPNGDDGVPNGWSVKNYEDN